MPNYNYENNNNNTGKILIGILVGAAAGAIAGILLAPEKGETTRQNLSDASLKFKDDINNSIQKGLDKFNSLKESAMGFTGFGDQQSGYGRKSPVGEQNNSANF